MPEAEVVPLADVADHLPDDPTTPGSTDAGRRTRRRRNCARRSPRPSQSRAELDRVTWTPPARPVWVERLIAHGDAVGGAEHLVGLDPDELVATAVASTGLDDFGADTWRPALRPCC